MEKNKDIDFIDLVLKWSIKDIFDETLYQFQVEKIPESFDSVDHYLRSFFLPLLEETRANIASSLKDIVKSPFAEVISFDEVKTNGSLVFDVEVDYWRNKCCDGRVPYRTSPGDIVVISNVKPEDANDLQRSGYWTFASVTDVNENDAWVNFKVRVPPNSNGAVKGMRRSCHVVFLVNVMPNKRVWNALCLRKNLNMIEKVLRPVHEIEQKCDVCSEYNAPVGEVTSSLLSKLNDIQANAIYTSLATVRCHHKASVELICGPPGTGKTRTLSVILVELMHMKCRTVTCTPTDVTTVRVASQLVKLVRESSKNEFDGLCPLGDILLFGNKNCEYEDITEISLDYRVDRLAECLAQTTGWNDCLSSMISFLEELSEQEVNFASSRFTSTFSSLRRCILMICTHVPIQFLRKENFDRMVAALSLLDSLKKILPMLSFFPKLSLTLSTSSLQEQAGSSQKFKQSSSSFKISSPTSN